MAKTKHKNQTTQEKPTTFFNTRMLLSFLYTLFLIGAAIVIGQAIRIFGTARDKSSQMPNLLQHTQPSSSDTSPPPFDGRYSYHEINRRLPTMKLTPSILKKGGLNTPGSEIILDESSGNNVQFPLLRMVTAPIRQKLVNFGGKLLCDFSQGDRGVCNYLTMKTIEANLLQGEFNLTKIVEQDPTLISKAEHYFEEETGYFKKYYREILKYKPIEELMNQIFAALAISNKKSADITDFRLKPMIQQFNNLFEERGAKFFTRHHIDGLNGAHCEILDFDPYEIVLSPKEIKKILPANGTSVRLIIKDHLNFRFELSHGLERKIENLASQDPHLLTIHRTNTGTIILTDPNLCAIKFSNISDFTKGFNYLLNFYKDTLGLRNPRVVAQHFSRSNELIEQQNSDAKTIYSLSLD